MTFSLAKTYKTWCFLKPLHLRNNSEVSLTIIFFLILDLPSSYNFPFIILFSKDRICKSENDNGSILLPQVQYWVVQWFTQWKFGPQGNVILKLLKV